MKTSLSLLGVLVVASGALWSIGPAEEKPLWLEDWPAAQRLARQSNKPVFAVMVCRH